LKERRIASALVGAAAAAAALWLYASHGRQARSAPEPVPIQDGRTLDFSNGSPEVKDSASDKAAMDAALRQMDAATKDITFKAVPPPKQ
jgi:hypothetical protein